MKLSHFVTTLLVLSCMFFIPTGVFSTERSIYLTGRSASPVSRVVNCTYALGYWKTHPDQWPVDQLTLGTVTYTESELLSILRTPPAGGNKLVSLAKQLIVAKLNIANGAEYTHIGDYITAADILILDLVVPPVGTGFLTSEETVQVTEALNEYNQGAIAPGPCD